jgi:hypothetical protein
MKSHLSNSVPMIDISSLGPTSQKEIRKIVADQLYPSTANTGRSRFIIVEIPADPANTNRLKSKCRESVKSQPEVAPQKLGKAEMRDLYDAYYPFYEESRMVYIKKFDRYGAKDYAAEKTIEKILVERQIVLSVRNVIVAMNPRMSK